MGPSDNVYRLFPFWLTLFDVKRPGVIKVNLICDGELSYVDVRCQTRDDRIYSIGVARFVGGNSDVTGIRAHHHSQCAMQRVGVELSYAPFEVFDMMHQLFKQGLPKQLYILVRHAGCDSPMLGAIAVI